MGRRKIPNLYKDIRILDFKECYALEKIHGTSANIKYKDGKLQFFSGGSNHSCFTAIFDQSKLLELFESVGYSTVTVYGEAYGGKQQGMRNTYGDDLKFVAFDVAIGEAWLDVANAHEIVKKLELEFVAYERGEATIEWINHERDFPSIQAKRNGIAEDKMREGVVVRPVREYRDYRGNRIITKHKRDEFKETKTKRDVNPEQLAVLEKAGDVAMEWVTPMRLSHVLDKMPEKGELKHIPLVIRAMIQDIQTEGHGEIVWSKAVEKAIGKETVVLYKKNISLL